MSDKKEPIPETRVRKLKKDGSWIRKEDDSTTSKPVAPESKPLVKQNSFVLTAVKRYEDSTNQKVEKVKFLHEGVQPYGSSIETQSNPKPKEPTKHLVTLPGEKNKAGNVTTSPLVDSASLPKRVSNAKIKQKELAASKVQLVNDTGVEKGIMSTPEKATDLRLKQSTDNTKPLPPADTDNQIVLSKQDQNGIIKDTADVKKKSLPKAVNVETVANETSLPNTQQPVVGGLSEVPAIKAYIKITESSEDLAPLPEPSTVIRAERVALCTPGDKTTAPNSEESCSQGLSKTPTGKAAITSGESEEKPVRLPEPVSVVKAKSEVQLANDAPVGQGVESTPEQASEHTKTIVHLEPSPNTDTQTSSEQELNKIAKATAKVKEGSSPEVPSANIATETDETSLPNQTSVLSGLPEVPSVKADFKSADSQEDLSPFLEPFIVVRAEKVDVSPVKDENTSLDDAKPVSNNSSQSPAPEALLKLTQTKEDSAAMQEPSTVITSESEVQSIKDGVVEQMNEPTHQCTGHGNQELTRKKNVEPLLSADNNNHTIPSDQDVNKEAKSIGGIEVESSPEVPSTKKETVTNETFPSKSILSVPSGLPEAPAVKVNVKSAESPETPAPLPGASTKIRAEIPTGCVPEDKTTPPKSEKPLSQDLSKTATDKSAITPGKSEEKPVALPERLPALKAKSNEQLADDAPVEPSVVSTPEQDSEKLLKKPVKVDSSPNTDTQTSSKQDANKIAKAAGEIEVESSPEVPSTKKETVTNETSPSKSVPSVPSCLPEAPAVKVNVKSAESPETPAPLPGASTKIIAEIPTGCVPEDKTTPTKSEQPFSQDLSKTPADKSTITPGKSDEKPLALPERLPALKAKSDEQLADDAPVEPSVVSTPEQDIEKLLKKPVKVDSSPNTDTQTSSEQDAKKIPKSAGEKEVESSPEVPSTKKETVTNETFPSKSVPSVPSGLPEAPAVKVDVKPAESPETPAPLPGASTKIIAGIPTGCVPEDKTTPPKREQPLSQDLSKTPTDKSAITSGRSEEKPVALPEPLPALKAKSDEQLADDAPAEPSVVSTPEQDSEKLLKKPVKVDSSPNTDTQTSSKQDANKIAKAAGEIEVESSLEVPSTKKETVTNETFPSKSILSVPSGLPEAPAVKVNVKSAESPEPPPPLPGASTKIIAEIPTGCVPEDKTTPPKSEKPLSQDISKIPADKSAITSGKSDEKPLALPERLPALKAKRNEQSADDAPVEPSVVSTPEQVSEKLLKKPMMVDSSPNTHTQTSSEQDAKKVPKAAGEMEVCFVYKETITDEAIPPKGDPVPGHLSEAPGVKTDVKPTESQEDPVKTLESTADLNTNNMVKPVLSQDTSTSTFKQQKKNLTCKIVAEDEFKPIPDILTLHKATPVNETTTSNIEIPATDSWRKSPPAETLVKAAEREEDSAVPPKQVPAICAESDVHPLDDAAAFNQSDEATSEHAPKQMPALKKVLLLGSSEDLSKIAEDLSSTKNNLRLFSKNDICTYCNQIIDGKAKIVFSEPSVICHPECLKCGVCVKDLGSLEITMFLRDEMIMCVDCYRKA